MKIDSNMIAQTLNQGNKTDILSKLNVGDVVRANVIEISSNELLLKLFDGTSFKAATLSEVNVKLGTLVEFLVKEKSDAGLILETLKNSEKINTASDNELIKELIKIDVEPNDKNIAISKELKENKVVLGKEVIDKTVEILTKFKDLNIEKAAFLSSNNIDLEGDKLQIFKELAQGNFKIGNSLNGLLTQLGDIEDNEVISKIANDLKYLKNHALKQGENYGTIKESDNISIKDELVKNLSNMESIRNIISKGNINVEKLAEELMVISDKAKGTTGVLNKEIFDTKSIIQLLNSNIKGFDSLNPQTKNTIFDFIKNIISEKAGINSKANDTKNNAFIQTKEINISTLKEAFDELNIKVQSKELEKDINIKNLYEDMGKKLEIIKTRIEESNIPSKGEILNTLQNINSNIRFSTELANYNAYIQIPLNFREFNTTGELYILKRNSKSKKIDPGNVTLFISLNTENLGKIDSLINVNKKNVILKIKVENEEIFEVLKDNYANLYNGLLDKGYKLVDFKFDLSEEESNIINVNSIADKVLSSNISIDYKI